MTLISLIVNFINKKDILFHYYFHVSKNIGQRCHKAIVIAIQRACHRRYQHKLSKYNFSPFLLSHLSATNSLFKILFVIHEQIFFAKNFMYAFDLAHDDYLQCKYFICVFMSF